MSHIHFEEEQRFTNLRWLWFVMLIPLLLTLVLLIEKTAEEQMLLFLTILIGWAPIVLILYNSKFNLLVNQNGLQYKFFPIVWKWKIIEKGAIASIEIRNSKTFPEKISIGYHYELLNKSIRMNIHGKKFVYVHLTNGKTLKIGTNNAESLYAALMRLLSPNEN